MQRLVPALVARAVDIAGGIDRLADLLQVSPHRVRFWGNGTATAPNHIITTLVDLILRDDLARAQQDRRQHPRVEAIEP